MDILGESRFDFLGKSRIALVFSTVMVLVGLAAAVAIPLGKAKLGTDFSGGIAIQFRFEKPYAIEEVRSLLKESGYVDADLQQFADPTRLLVKVKPEGGDLRGVSAAIGEVFKSGLAGNPFEVEQTTEVGPTVGGKLQRDALTAIVIALALILLYVAWRFELRFGVAAVAATFHDVLAVLGVLFVMDREINFLIVTALLTIAGYSLTDTVVVFDRIRENLRRKTREELPLLVNRSINEVLRRTIVTSLTTLLVLVALLFLGGEVIHDFSLTLFLGVLVGTYSSIFVASPILLAWKGRKGKLLQR
ncbi:MAG TPA: protein translocase subunit SecF [Deltaproteobacteria bacterium]|nr:protein translocase subunit SecF [Deltaproteobacteria bacterium]